MQLPLPDPDRRSYPAAGSGSTLEGTGTDMERALGALRDFTRRDILLRFYTDHKPRSVDEVARAAGIHRSVAFDHLERLVALGYLEVQRRRGLPGKPAKIYRLTAGPVQISHPMRRYDVLAEALARSASDIRGAGRSLGARIARPRTASTVAALEPMVELGASYDVEVGGVIACTNCLFAEVCRRVPAVCEFHAGVIEGLTGRDGAGPRIRSLGFQGPSGCKFMEVDR